MDAKFFVPFDTAKLLKQKGYNEQCTFYYGDGIIRTERQLYTNKELSDNTPNWLFNECISAPTYHEVVDWFEEKGYLIETMWARYESNVVWFCRVAQKDTNIYPTREQALNASILKALEML